jgi:hypothetical protein
VADAEGLTAERRTGEGGVPIVTEQKMSIRLRRSPKIPNDRGPRSYAIAERSDDSVAIFERGRRTPHLFGNYAATV